MNRRVRLTAGLGVPMVGRGELQQFAELLDRKAGVAHDAAHGDGVDRVVARNSEDSRPVAHDDVLALAKDNEARLFERPDCIKMIDARELGQDQAAISTTRTSSPRSCSSTTAKYSTIAIRIFSSASASVTPCDQQPGSPGTDAANPSSER